MKKFIISLCLLLGICFSFGTIEYSAAANDKYLKQITNSEDINISTSSTGKESIYKVVLKVAESVKTIFFVVALIYFFIITIKLIVSSNTEEEIGNFKKGILWISIGLIVINIAVAVVNAVYNKNMSMNAGETTASINTTLANIGNNLMGSIITPFINLLEFGSAFFFILIMIFAFFKLITSNGNEESAKTGKMTVLYAILGFIVVKIAATLVFSVYGSCKSNIAGMFGATCKSGGPNLSGFGKIIFEIINWMNSFVAILVIILIIFIGAQIIFSNGDEEKVSSAKKSLIYIVIGIGILLFNFLILQFFFNA